MKFILILIVIIFAFYYGISYALKSPRFYDYIFSKSDISPRFCYYYGTILVQAGKKDSAVNFFDIVVSTYPDTPYAPLSMIAIADIYNERFKHKEALAMYGKFLDMYPGHDKTERVKKSIEFIRANR